jgi:hypothetical protein
MSRKYRGLAVAIIAQSLIRGPLVPVPQDRRSKTASAAAWSARITVLAGVITWKSHG